MAMSVLDVAIDPATYEAIERLVQEHAWLIDHGEAGKLPDLFTGDGRLIGIGPERAGRAAIAEWAMQRQAMTDRRSRHVQTNIRLEPASEGVIHGTVVLTLHRHDGPGEGDPGPLLVGEYADVYMRCPDGRWRFAERRLTVLFGK
jgi:hypothetical protein